MIFGKLIQSRDLHYSQDINICIIHKFSLTNVYCHHSLPISSHSFHWSVFCPSVLAFPKIPSKWKHTTHNHLHLAHTTLYNILRLMHDIKCINNSRLLLSSNLLYEYVSVCLSTHQLMGIWVVMYMLLCGQMFSHLLGKYLPSIGFAGSLCLMMVIYRHPIIC